MMATSTLLKLARNLHATRNLEEVMDRVNEAVSEATRYRRAWLSFVTRGAQGVEIVGYATNENQMLHECPEDLDIASDRFLLRTFGSSEPYVIEDARDDPEANQGLVEARGIRTCIVVPILLTGDRIGAFQIATFAEQGVMPPTHDEMERPSDAGNGWCRASGRANRSCQSLACIAHERLHIDVAASIALSHLAKTV